MLSNEQFLSENLHNYIYPDLVRRDINTALEKYKYLRLQSEFYTADDGNSSKLICLDGTIPVNYMGLTYNIPIAIYLLTTHPHEAPIVYVRPTNTMEIRPDQYVDYAGLVRIPYMSDWKHPQSDLVGLISVLRVVFGEKCPVFSKSSYVANRPMPVPGSNPPFFGPACYPSPITTSTNGKDNNIGGSQLGCGWQIPVPMPGTTGLPQLPIFPAPFSQPQNPKNSAVFPNVGNPACMGISTPDQIYNSGTVNEEHLRLSVLSAVVDQVRRVQKEIIYQHQDDLQAMRQTQADFLNGYRKVQDMIKRMNQERDDVLANTQNLHKMIQELEDASTKLKKSDSNFEVDEAVDTTAPLYRQLVVSFAEEQAIEDAIYYLGEAMGKNVLDVEIYLKKVRELSRRQFMLRATVQKCREKAGLPI